MYFCLDEESSFSFPLSSSEGALSPQQAGLYASTAARTSFGSSACNGRARVFFHSKLGDVSETRYEMKRTNRSENPVPGGLLFGPRVRRGRAWCCPLASQDRAGVCFRMKDPAGVSMWLQMTTTKSLNLGNFRIRATFERASVPRRRYTRSAERRAHLGPDGRLRHRVLERWREHPIGKVLRIARLYRARAEVAIVLVRVVRVDKVSRLDIVE